MEKERNQNKRNRFANTSIIRICKFVHMLLTIAVFWFCLDFYNSRYNSYDVGQTRFLIFVGLYVIALLFSLRTYRAYDFGMTSSGLLIYSQTLADLVADVCFYVIFVVANSKVFNPLPLAGFFFIQVLINVAWSLVVNRVYFRLNAPRKTVVFYCNESELVRLKEIYSRRKNFNIVSSVKYTQNTDWLSNIENMEAVFLADIPTGSRNIILEYCVENGIECYTTPCNGDIIMMGAKHMDMYSVPVFKVSRAVPDIEYAIIKRAGDIFCSLIGIIILSPVMALTALAIRLYDRGPALYKQVRLTRDGKEFEILKFRSMRVNAESDGVARLATDKDDRITPVGRIIRACRLDELPQLFNILKGDMSIVGPRPERPEIAQQYLEELPAFNLRLQVQAGLTGLAQVYGRYNTEPADKLQMDLMYVNNMSILQDFKLIMATVKILFIKDSTSGTAEGQTTAMAKKEQVASEKYD